MKTVTASNFRANCLKLLDDVAETGEPIVITKHGEPVARLVPLQRKPKSLIGAHEGQIEILGDIVAPIDVAWDADR